MNGAGRALKEALAAGLALIIIDVTQVVLYRNSAELARVDASVRKTAAKPSQR